MASDLYAKGKEKFLSGTINLTSDTIKASLIDTASYTVNLSTHEFYSDLGGVMGSTSGLSSKTVTAGVFDAADTSVTSIVSSAYCKAIVIWKDTGVAGTSPLIAYIDGFAPTKAQGGTIEVTWDSGTYKIFSL